MELVEEAEEGSLGSVGMFAFFEWLGLHGLFGSPGLLSVFKEVWILRVALVSCVTSVGWNCLDCLAFGFLCLLGSSVGWGWLELLT